MNTNNYTLNGQSIPGGGVVTYRATPLEGAADRDESGYLHRQVLRTLGRWEFSYRDLTGTALQQLLALPLGDSCQLDGPQGLRQCYLSQLTHRRHDTLTAPAFDLTFTLEEN